MDGETEAFTSGRVLTVGDNDYTVTMGEDGSWSAAYNVVTKTTMLGGSGDMRTLMRAENGDWTIDEDTAVTSGDMYAADGRNYELTYVEGEWHAAFVPNTMDVALGASGETVTVTQVEAGGYTLPDGTMVGEGATTDASNGATYSVMMTEDGSVMAMYMENPVTVTLGNNGGTITLVLQEDQETWMRVGMEGAFTSGMEVTVEATGDIKPDGRTGTVMPGVMNTYVVTLDAETGMWSAEYQAHTVMVDLGNSGAMQQLIRDEDTTWWTDPDNQLLQRRYGHADDRGSRECVQRQPLHPDLRRRGMDRRARSGHDDDPRRRRDRRLQGGQLRIRHPGPPWPGTRRGRHWQRHVRSRELPRAHGRGRQFRGHAVRSGR